MARRGERVRPLAAGLVLAALAACRVPFADDLLFTTQRAQPPVAEDCKRCHGEVFEEWSQSPHAGAWRSTHFRSLTADYSADACLGCHAPAPLGEKGEIALRADHRGEGVTCISCHSSTAPGAAPLAMRGPHARTTPVEVHPVLVDSLYTKPELCGTCHSEVLEQWRAAPAPADGTEKKVCQSCHMPEVRRTIESVDPERAYSRVLVALGRPVDGRRHRFAVPAEPWKDLELHAARDSTSWRAFRSAVAKCEACHRVTPLEAGEEKSFRYHGVPFASCGSCHSDPHAGRALPFQYMKEIRAVALDSGAPAAPPRSAEHPLAGRECKDCHSETGFRAESLHRGGFDHAADTRFPLDGAHGALACESCHTPERRRQERRERLAPGTAARPDCAACHEDPHRGAIRRDGGCASCHSPSGWQLAFDHGARTKFALDPQHASLACASCHEDDRFQAAGRQCADCHAVAAVLLAGRLDGARAAPDPHADVRCGDCHGPTPAENRPAALAAKCVTCHTPEYGALLATWQGKLDALASVSTLSPADAERLRRSGVHNFALAHERLRAAASPR